MGMSLYDLLADEHESILKVGKGDIKLVTIDAEMISPATWEIIASLEGVNAEEAGLQRTIEVLHTFAQVVTDLVLRWDVIGKDGQPVPLVLEEVKQLPLKFLKLVIQHVTSGAAQMGEAQPGKMTMKSSSDTSSRQASLASAQNGIKRSSRPIAFKSRPGNSTRATGRSAKNGHKPQ